jgi:NAD(P)-dependent dehydrogenase (short-subunit alcohol dehydrogenase family)
VTSEPQLAGQTVVVIGGSSGIGMETARLAAQDGAGVIIAGRHADRLKQAAAEVGARDTAAFDATDQAALSGFFAALPGPVDHVLVTGPGPYYAPLAELDRDRAHLDYDHHIWLPVAVAQQAVGRVRPGGTLLFMSGTGGRSRGPGLSIMGAITAALPALIANLAVEIAPIRVNLMAAGFVDTPLSASLLGADLDKRRAQLRATLPIRRVVGPADIAALAVHLMINTAVTGATYDIDGGEQLVPGALRGARSAGRHHHRRLQGHRRRPGGRVPRARLGGGGHCPQDQAVGSR